MITPTFRCRQDRGFVIVEIYLPSLHCKISNAEFDITPFQFTFHCNPYYLRLQFQSQREYAAAGAGVVTISPTAIGGNSSQPQGLCEGKGERATYDLATSTMTVFLPKAVDGELFLHLDMPNILLATHAQRKALLKPKIEVMAATATADDDDTAAADSKKKGGLIEEVGGDDEWEDDNGSGEEDADGDDDDAGDELETEFVQMQIGNGAAAAKKAFGAPDDEEEAKMAVKNYAVDNSLLALESKMQGADDEDDAANKDGGASASAPPLVAEGYGFNKEFRNVFEVMSRTDAQQNTNYVGEVVDVKDPDRKSQLDRRQERLMRETEEYDDATFWGCVNEDIRDPESELGELFAAIGGPSGGAGGRGGAPPRFVPWYIEAFEAQLKASGMSFVSVANANANTSAAEAAASLLTPSAIPKFAVEEEGEDYGSSTLQSATKGVIVAWEGNTGTVVQSGAAPAVQKPLVMEVVTGNERLLAATAEADAGASDNAANVVLTSRPVAAATAATAQSAAAAAPTTTPALRLAVPTAPPAIAFTKEEAQMLLHIQPRAAPITPIPSGAAEVCALTVDLLCAFVFDYIATLGDGSVESIWTVTKLSPSLTFLDQPRNVYEALLGFARRVFIYPYVRHWALVHRVVRDVGVLLLSGPQAVIKALLGLKHVLDNTDHHHMLSKLYVNPLISYYSGCLMDAGDAAAIAASLQRTALEVHGCMSFEPSEEVMSGAVVPPHVIDMLCDGMDGAMDAADDAAVKAAADAAAALAASDDAEANAHSSPSAATTKGKGLVMAMLKESADKSKAEAEAKAKQHEEEAAGTPNDLCRRYGAIQYEPLAPFTLGLPIDMEDEDDE